MAKKILRSRYLLTKKIASGKISVGVPDLWLAQDAGDTYLAKLWKRQQFEGDEIKALWNREVRNLERLQGYPGAAQFFIRLHDLGSTDDEYFAIQDIGRRLRLSDMLEKRSRFSWLTNLSEINRRRSIWEGLTRIGEALTILHRDGVLHRSLSPASIFADEQGNGDFRLGDFEWSLRIAGKEGASAIVGRKADLRAPELERSGEYSTATDWFDFGLVLAEIFGAPVAHSKKRAPISDAIRNSTFLREGEKDLILSLLQEDAEFRLHQAEEIVRRLRDTAQELNSTATKATRKLVLGVRISSSSEFARAIDAASGGAAPITDPAAQQAFVKRDLRGEVRVITRNGAQPHIVLRGEQLEYRVKPWSSDGLTTWDVGFCESCETSPRAFADDTTYGIDERELDVQPFPNVRHHLKRIRDRSAQWNRVFSWSATKSALPSHLRDIHDFFRITQQLDTVLTAAQIWPVRVLETNSGPDETEITVTPFEEPERNELALHLKLPNPSEQMREWFELGVEKITAEDEDNPKSHRYQMLDDRTIAGDSGSISWKFARAQQNVQGPRYTFRCPRNVKLSRDRLYIARNHGGTLTQIKRRHRAIENLRFHEGLLGALSDPRYLMRTGDAPLPDGKKELPLDVSKIEALRKIWNAQPLFAVQGPPGTGKTTLILAFADRLFSEDSTAQFVLSAHSHHTVDDVRTKLASLFANDDHTSKPVIIRLGAADVTEHDPEIVTSTILEGFKGSALLAEAPEFLRGRIRSALETSDRSAEGRLEFQTMQNLVQEAANVTLATSNDANLADFATRGRRFDWSIIEEAGKAHGFDMAAGLQQSHRLLMIGDHHQLPPFNARVFRELLAEPLRVRKAIETGAQFARGLVDVSIVTTDEGEDKDAFVNRCLRWKDMVSLFEHVFEASKGPSNNGPSITLRDQHRMHPYIANLVGRIFYEDEEGSLIRSPDETIERFKGPPPFSLRQNSWLRDEPIVWCNVDWIQRKEWAQGEIDGLFASQVEAKKVVSILEEIVPCEGKSCSIQILSPYNDQLAVIRHEIEEARQSHRLEHMFRDPFNLHLEKRSGATVDEFQGSEADIVVVSLVRNNGLAPWKSVGFLKEKNRMNVLLSRAKRKLIIVGSWEFFRSRCDSNTSADEEYAYIGRMMDEFEQSLLNGHAARVD